jgi:hypothetical protein
MHADDFDEGDFFRSLASAQVRYLLIGRRAIAALGAPVLTSDYDLWIAFEDVEKLNAVARDFDLFANHLPDEARARGRYVLEGSEHVDVMIARSKSTTDGQLLTFTDAYARRVSLNAYGTTVALPSIEDLILTKRWAMRPKDVLDINFLDALRKASQLSKANQ